MGKVFTTISQSQEEMSGGQAKLFCKCGGAASARFASKLAEERTARATASVATKANAVAITDINFNFRHVTILHPCLEQTECLRGARPRRNQYDALEEVLSPSMNFHGDSMEPNQLRVGLKLFSKNRPY
jgi:hypothetical protein